MDKTKSKSAEEIVEQAIRDVDAPFDEVEQACARAAIAALQSAGRLLSDPSEDHLERTAHVSTSHINPAMPSMTAEDIVEQAIREVNAPFDEVEQACARAVVTALHVAGLLAGELNEEQIEQADLELELGAVDTALNEFMSHLPEDAPDGMRAALQVAFPVLMRERDELRAQNMRLETGIRQFMRQVDRLSDELEKRPAVGVTPPDSSEDAAPSSTHDPETQEPEWEYAVEMGWSRKYPLIQRITRSFDQAMEEVSKHPRRSLVRRQVAGPWEPAPARGEDDQASN